MTVAHDAIGVTATFSTVSPKTWTHTPVGTPKGVLVFVTWGTDATDHITGAVTYGGVAMTRVRDAFDTADEPGGAVCYFLGVGIPTGAQTVSVTHDASATVKDAVSVTVTAATDTEITVSGELSVNQSDPQIALDTGATSALRYFGIYSGLAGPGNLTLLADETAVDSHDFGTFNSRVDRQTTASTGSFTVGYTANTDDVAMVAVAIQEVAGGAVTGTIAVTQAADVGALSGTVLNPITGTIAATQADQTGAFIGAESFTGTIAVTQDAQTMSAAGAVVSGFASVGSFGTANSTSAGTTLALTPTATVEVGNLAVLVIANDATATIDGISSTTAGAPSSEVASITDTGGNTWQLIGSVATQASTAAANNVATTMWKSVIATQLTGADTITITFTASIVSKAVTGHEFTTGGGVISAEDVVLAGTSGVMQSLTLGDLPSREYLLIRGLGAETNSVTAFTNTTNYTSMTLGLADTGVAATSVEARAEFRILSGTGDTSAPSWISIDHATIYVALFEGTAPIRPSIVSGGPMVSGTVAGVTPLWPVHEVNDVALLICEVGAADTATFSAANGFAAVANSPQSPTGSKLYAFWCRATSTLMSAPVFNDPGDHIVAKILLVKGCVTAGDPWDVTAGDTSTASTSVSIPGATTTVAETLIAAISSQDIDNTAAQFSAWANTDLTRVRELYEAATTAGTGGGFGVAIGRKAAAGAYGATTATVGSTTQGRLSIALRATGTTNVTGTIAVTQADQVAAFTGTVTPPAVTGTIAVTQDDQTGALTGTLGIIGILGTTQDPNTAALSGTVNNPVTGVLGAVQDDNDAALLGTIVSDGTLNSIQDDQTGAFTGTVLNPISGTISVTQGDQTGVFTGTHTPPAVTGTIGVTQDDQTGSFTGISAFGIVGVLGAVQQDQAGSFTGTVLVAVTGVLSTVQANQTTIFTGSVANPAGAIVGGTCVLGGPTAVCTISPVVIVAGSNVLITTTFRDANGDLADPTSIDAVVQAPDGTQSTPTPTSSSVGIWVTTIPTDQAGYWFYQITGAGSDIDVVCQGSFCAEASLILV